jgi:hypothetical protein
MIQIIIGLIVIIIFLSVIAQSPDNKEVPIPPPTEPSTVPGTIPVPKQFKPSLADKYSYLLETKGILKDAELYREEGDCELIAKQYKKEYGGHMVLYMPYMNGQLITGKISGAWGNMITVDGFDFYVDYRSQTLFYNSSSTAKENALFFYENILMAKHQMPVSVKMFVHGVDEIPFPITWNFGEV